MAQIIEETIIITLSRLVPTGKAGGLESAVTGDLISTLETVAKELVPAGVVVEATRVVD